MRPRLSPLRSAALALLCLAAWTPIALADDPGELVAPTGPAPQIYGDSDRLIVAQPLAGSVLSEPPAQVVVFFRKQEFDLEPSSLELWIDGVEYSEALEFHLDRVWLPDTQELFSEEGPHTILARARDTSGAYYKADIVFEWIGLPCPGGCPWPIDPTDQTPVVGNLMANLQTFASPYYFHHGLDIRAPNGTDVKSSTDGTVVKIIQYQTGTLAGDRYWEIAIEDPWGYVWQYHHIEPTSITVSEGASVSAGQKIGEVVAWNYPINGFTYHHLHLNVARWVGGGPVPGPYGDGFRYYDPLRFLVQGSYVDAIAPAVAISWFVENEDYAAYGGQPPGPNEPKTTLQGDVDVIAKINDYRTLIPPAEGQLYYQGPREVEYEIIPVNPHCGVGYVPRTRLMRFDQVPGGPTNAGQEDMLEKIYRYFFTAGSVTLHSVFDRDDRKLYYNVTNTHNGVPDDANGYWDTDQSLGVFGGAFPDGEYRFLIYTSDFDGNQTTSERRVILDNGLGFLGLCPPFFVDGPKWEDPIEIRSLGGEVFSFIPPTIPLEFTIMSQGRSRMTIDHESWPVWRVDVPEYDVTVAIGLLDGQTATADYYPAMGDLVIEANAEVQLLPIGSGAQFDPDAGSSQPLSLRISTRLARDPSTGEALIGAPLAIDRSLRLVLAETIDIQGEPFTLRSQGTSGAGATFGVGAQALPALEERGGMLLVLVMTLIAAGALRAGAANRRAGRQRG